jgi:hypothetical protein
MTEAGRPANDVFLVFVEGSEGNEAAYASWFASTHMEDMRRLPGVASASAFRLEALDGEPAPRQLCAIYESASVVDLLGTIAAAKGTPALPESDVQGPMVWRALEGVRSHRSGAAPGSSGELICMVPGPWGEAEDRALSQWLAAHGQDVAALRQTRLSPVQPKRGSEFAVVLFVTPLASADAAALGEALLRAIGKAGARLLLAKPLQGG